VMYGKSEVFRGACLVADGSVYRWASKGVLIIATKYVEVST
jgi:hypothetical protein